MTTIAQSEGQLPYYRVSQIARRRSAKLEKRLQMPHAIPIVSVGPKHMEGLAEGWRRHRGANAASAMSALVDHSHYLPPYCFKLAERQAWSVPSSGGQRALNTRGSSSSGVRPVNTPPD